MQVLGYKIQDQGYMIQDSGYKGYRMKEVIGT